MAPDLSLPWLIVIILSGGTLAYGAFCRAVKMSDDTLPVIRWTMAMQGAAGLAIVGAVLLRPDLFVFAVGALAMSTAMVQVSTARYWVTSTPFGFTKAAHLGDPTMPKWYDAALKHLGQREVPGPSSNPWIAKLWQMLPGGAWFWTTYKADDSKLPWCGAFVASVMQQCAIAIPKNFASAMAWASWGAPLRGPCVGAVVVFQREGGGHVGFVAGRTEAGRLVVLGGNQGDAVKLSTFDLSRVVAYRYPSDAAITGIQLTFSALPIVTPTDVALSTNEA